MPQSHRTITVPESLHVAITRTAIQLGAQLGRRVPLHEVISAAIIVARDHTDELGQQFGPCDPDQQPNP